MGLNRELDGVFVVSLEQAVAAPYCGMLLADAGARVVKVERPDGDFARSYDRGAAGQSTIFAWLNHGKESICLDLNAAEDEALLRAMLGRADVFLHNLAPGALEKRGFGGDVLRAENPGLITCDITGYGRDGAAAKKKAYDFLIQAEAGLCAVTGTEDSPSRVGVSITDLSAGLTAFSAILRALIQRGRTGEGLDLSVSMFDVIADWMNMPLMAHRYFGPAPQRLGLTHTFVAPYGAFEAADGVVMISIQNNREFRSFCDDILGQAGLADDPRFADNPDRVANRDALTEIINAVFRRAKRADLIARLEVAQIACARLNEVADLSEHDFLRNLSVQFGGMEISVADLPVQTDAPRRADVPALGEHGDALRAEFAGGMAAEGGR
jgi:formyl-CoA transferase